MTTEERAKDLDETRRLLYMALLRPDSDRWYDLAGTLINALAHHSRMCSAEDAEAYVRTLCNRPGRPVHGHPLDDDAASVAWAKDLIARITEELDDAE